MNSRQFGSAEENNSTLKPALKFNSFFLYSSFHIVIAFATPIQFSYLHPDPARRAIISNIDMVKHLHSADGVQSAAPVPLRRSSRLRNSRRKKTSYLDILPTDVAVIICEQVLDDTDQREAISLALALPSNALAEILGTLSEGTDGIFNTVGKEAHKDLNTLMRTVGRSVHTLKFKDKWVTKGYLKTVKTHCPNVATLSVDLALFTGPHSNPEVVCESVDLILKSVTHGSKQLEEFHLRIGSLSRAYLDMFGRYAGKMNTIVLQFRSVSINALYECWEKLWSELAADGAVLRKVVLMTYQLQCVEWVKSRLCLDYAKQHCPNVEVVMRAEGEEIILTD